MSQSLRLSQIEPLPKIKGVTVGKTIGHGGFGVVKSALGKLDHEPGMIAVKFVNIKMAARNNITLRKLITEARIQRACSTHRNVITLYDYGVDDNWVWMAMELGANGELFDKIEPDRGVDEEVAQFYFIQLINAVDYIHRLGVAHRDIKPENLVLDSEGNLKLTDFGLAVVFRKKGGPKRISTLPCGSPPYIAPEMVTKRYDPEMMDIWSCGIVLFVLLTGKIAWEIPHPQDPDYDYFIKNQGEVLIDPWNKLPIGALSLLRKILDPNPKTRISIRNIHKQPWFSKKNSFMNIHGLCNDTLHLTTRLLVSLYINLSDEEFNKVNTTATQAVNSNRAPETQPVEYLVDDMAQNKLPVANMRNFSSSQVEYTEHSRKRQIHSVSGEDDAIFSMISKDPAALQFIGRDRREAITRKVSQLHRTNDGNIDLLAFSLTRFFSLKPLKQILLTILEALLKLGIRTNEGFEDNEATVETMIEDDELTNKVSFRIFGRDYSNLQISGLIIITRIGENGKKIEFVKGRGDPLGWRRIFREVTILCRDIVYVEQIDQKK